MKVSSLNTGWGEIILSYVKCLEGKTDHFLNCPSDGSARWLPWFTTVCPIVCCTVNWDSSTNPTSVCARLDETHRLTCVRVVFVCFITWLLVSSKAGSWFTDPTKSLTHPVSRKTLCCRVKDFCSDHFPSLYVILYNCRYITFSIGVSWYFRSSSFVGGQSYPD